MDEHDGEVKHRDKPPTKPKSKKSRTTITLPREPDAEEMEGEPLIHAEHAMTSREKCIFVAFFVIHVIIFEYPLLCIEGTLRTIILAVIAGCLCIVRLFSPEYHIWPFVRETLRSAAVTATVLIPGAALLPYRKFRFDDSWDLSPLPTVLGYVDCRRFMTITLGQGHTASNRYCPSISDCDDSWKGPVLLFPLNVVYSIRQFSFRYRTQELNSNDNVNP